MASDAGTRRRVMAWYRGAQMTATKIASRNGTRMPADACMPATTITNAASVFDPVLAVYTDGNDCCPWREDHDSGTGDDAQISFYVRAGQHYEILSNHFAEIVARSATWLAGALNAG